MGWAKIDTALHRNPKIRMAGRDAREVFLFIILANAEQKADGQLPAVYADPEYLADSLQCSVEEARNGVKRCVTFHLLHVTDDVLSIVGWDSEWRVKNSTDRVAKYRAKKKAESKQGFVKGETLRNVSSVTRNACNALDITEQTDRTDNKSHAHRPDARERFDFAAIYAMYPRKVGKARGLKLCASKVKSEQKYQQLASAAQEMERLWSGATRDQLKFCPQFDTWVSKDRWLDAEQQGPSLDSKAEAAQYRPQLEAL